MSPAADIHADTQERREREEERTRTSDSGEYLHPDENKYSDSYRKFCKQHLRRGDCGREDADDNYEPLDGVGPGNSSNVIESPATFGGVVELEPESK